jgi:hypothetical protein
MTSAERSCDGSSQSWRWPTTQRRRSFQPNRGNLDVEALTAADRRRLEQALLAGTPPDFEQLTKHVYCGWNHDLLGRLLGESFGTAFC